ncbi:hypothetical protein BDP27DRAFT_757033 [Rhodocollybia butyracea]|uniref:Uncharacterized protein n=1 Tax=Rhodocollybia butyracea TaxID=206335 RepID=A0A9P5PTP5_9AGAR|nr:hypothetical protein BDP27DRAFT_757033 [Rhodocollybia butyracea]
MFSFGQPKLPANWPPNHHKCNRRKCGFPNPPIPAPGKYPCHGCDKGTYSVSTLEAEAFDARNPNVFYVPGSSPSQPQKWDLNQEFPPFVRADVPKWTQVSRTQRMREAQVQGMAAKVVRAPDVYAGRPRANVAEPSIRIPRSGYPHGQRSQMKPQVYSNSSDHTHSASNGYRAGPVHLAHAENVDATRQRNPRRYRVMNA